MCYILLIKFECQIFWFRNMHSKLLPFEELDEFLQNPRSGLDSESDSEITNYECVTGI